LHKTATLISLRSLSLTLWLSAIGLTAVGVVFMLVDREASRSVSTFGYRELTLLLPLTFSCTGALICLRRHQNPIGWLFLGVGFLIALDVALEGYAIRGLLASPGSLPAAEVAAWVHNGSGCR